MNDHVGAAIAHTRRAMNPIAQSWPFADPTGADRGGLFASCPSLYASMGCAVSETAVASLFLITTTLASATATEIHP
jgi:hypothetical protein